jgi:hypothetical protein
LIWYVNPSEVLDELLELGENTKLKFEEGIQD